MPEPKSTTKKPTPKKRTTSAKSGNPKPKTNTAKAKTTSAKSKPKSSPKLTDVKSVKKPAQNPATTQSTAKKSAARKSPAVKTTLAKPKHPAKIVDSFTATLDRSKTTAGNTTMDFQDLEKRVESYKPETTTADKKPLAILKNLNSSLVFRTIGSAFSLSLLITSAILGAMIITINFLPSSYLLPALAVLITIAVSFSIIMVHHKIKPAIKAPFFLLSLIFSLVYIFGINYLNKTFDFFNSLQGQNYLTEDYYVVVDKDSAYTNLQDLQNKSITTYDEGTEVYQEALQKLQSLITANFSATDSINSLTRKLLDHKTDAILISAVHQKALDDIAEKGEDQFSTRTKIIHTITVRVNVENFASDKVNVATEPFTVYISGIDASSDLFGMQRGLSDVNMLVTVNPTTHEVLLTSIPRDYYVQFHGTTGDRNKLTHAGMYGIQMSVQTIEDFLDININYYLKVNFATIVGLVDAIDGIEVTTDQTVSLRHASGYVVPKGTSHMDGRIALAFARERFGYSSGDRHRIKNQQDVITAIIKKISSSTVILTQYSEILNQLSSSLSTNIGQDEISSLIKLQLQSMPSWKIGQYRLDGSNSHGPAEFMGSNENRFVMEPYPETIQTAHDNIAAILEGKPLSNLKLTEE